MSSKYLTVRRCGMGIVALCLSSWLAAQSQAPGTLLLKEGEEVKLKFAEAISSKTANLGDPVNFILDEDLKVGNVIVAKTGAKALGEVTNAKKAGMMGKGGELNVRLTYLKTESIRVRLRGTKGKEGESKEGTSIALMVLFGPVGIFKHGKNIEVKDGTPLTVYVDQDTSLPPVTGGS